MSKSTDPEARNNVTRLDPTRRAFDNFLDSSTKAEIRALLTIGKHVRRYVRNPEYRAECDRVRSEAIGQAVTSGFADGLQRAVDARQRAPNVDPAIDPRDEETPS